MHRFLLRIRKEVFDHAKAEAIARGISINDYLTYCIEVAMAEFMSESAEAFKDNVKRKAIHKYKNYLISKHWKIPPTGEFFNIWENSQSL